MKKVCGKCGKIHNIGACKGSRIDYRINKIETNEYSNRWSKFLRSSVWRNKRVHILKRDGGLCVCCKLKYNRVTRAVAVHHIEKINEDNKLRDNNLVSLCYLCHNRVDYDYNYFIFDDYIEEVEGINDYILG